VDIRLPGKGDTNSHGARPVHLISTMIKWTRTSRLTIKNSLSGVEQLDLLLLPHPAPLATWEALLSLQQARFCRST